MENQNQKEQVKISVITPSIRPKGLAMNQRCLENQTFKDFEWLTEIGLKNKSDLNTALNRMIRRAKGELLVFYQDYIKIDNDGLERFWNAYQEKKAFYTASVNDDWRKTGFGKRNWQEWEIDWGACPKETLTQIGGFDESLDEFWGFDNVNVGLRADMAGYDIICIDNPAIGIKHEEAPMKVLRNPIYHNQRLDEIRRGLRFDFIN